MNNGNLAEQLSLLPGYLTSHLQLTLIALVIGILICLPLALIVVRVRWMQWPTLALASVMQTIPGIALLALMVPILGMIGFVPALLALILYSMLPILRNSVTGILNVDPSLTEAAAGIGMSSRQSLMQVELPLALPVIVAGIRTSAVWVVGTATLSTPVGATSLGNYIFSGLQTQNYTAVLVGSVSAAVLAIVLDQIIRLVEIAVSKRSRKIGLIAAFGVGIVILIAVLPLVGSRASTNRMSPIVVGSKPFTEQYILGETISRLLEAADLEVDFRSSMGSTILFDALKSSQIDCYVDYSGTIWTNIMKRSDYQSRQQVVDEMSKWLEDRHGIVCLGPLGFENTYALAVKRSLAEQFEIETIADLAAHAQKMDMASDYEFFSRPEWKSIRDQYNLSFRKLVTLDPALMYSAIREDEVDVISAYSTDGRILDYDLVVLKDPKLALPPYDAVLLLSPSAASKPSLRSALQEMIGAISDEQMRRANNMVDLKQLPVSEAARSLLENIRNK